VKTFRRKQDVFTKIVERYIILDVVTNCITFCEAEVVAVGGKIKSSSLHTLDTLSVGEDSDNIAASWATRTVVSIEPASMKP